MSEPPEKAQTGGQAATHWRVATKMAGVATASAVPEPSVPPASASTAAR